MQLTLGDVARSREDITLGTVAGIADHGEGKLVVLRLPNGGLSFVEPCSLVVVGRYAPPASTRRSVVALVFLGFALLVAYISCRSAEEVGADWLLTLFAGLGGFKVVAIAYQCWARLTGPRRFRV
ncbi:hypothetical protein Q3V23_24900 [Streptomyces sp. VNUA116]|uniref:hypothetical protein n=1 Tax=Streptomyces sp. VNUA116 TaxID=3062449 RepID=UPI002677537A|nr:hypothetical protein [Streptomyces sp. VNUA116]WKU47038.1 hypothetical protein Q3V23_24900 [Streptomyces sp. VNUA116]